MPTQQLYLFTGKGGVGKTLTSLSLAYHLKQNGQKVLFMDSHTTKDKPHTLCQKLQLPHTSIDTLTCLEKYAQLKLHSKTLAKWLTRLEFTSSLINVVPGINYIIFLGHIAYLLKKDRDLTIILDAPSSGHVITMLESLKTYSQIFRSGLIFNDIQSIHDFILSPHKMEIYICHIPTHLSLSEGCELRDHLQNLFSVNTLMILNAALSLTLANYSEKLPPYLSKRIQLESQVLDQYPHSWIAKIPYLTPMDDREKIVEMAPYWEGILP